MVRNRKRTTQKASWGHETMAAALKAVSSGRTQREVSRTFGIPLSTLRNRVKFGITGFRLGRKPVFTVEQEEEIVDHVLLMSKMFSSVSPIALRKLVFQYAEINGIRNTFDKIRRVAGKDWLWGFLQRNPQIKEITNQHIGVKEIPPLPGPSGLNLQNSSIQIDKSDLELKENIITNENELGKGNTDGDVKPATNKHPEMIVPEVYPIEGVFFQTNNINVKKELESSSDSGEESIKSIEDDERIKINKVLYENIKDKEPCPTTKEAFTAFKTLERWFKNQREVREEHLLQLRNIENIMNIIIKTIDKNV